MPTPEQRMRAADVLSALRAPQIAMPLGLFIRECETLARFFESGQDSHTVRLTEGASSPDSAAKASGASQKKAVVQPTR